MSSGGNPSYLLFKKNKETDRHTHKRVWNLHTHIKSRVHTHTHTHTYKHTHTHTAVLRPTWQSPQLCCHCREGERGKREREIYRERDLPGLRLAMGSEGRLLSWEPLMMVHSCSARNVKGWAVIHPSPSLFFSHSFCFTHYPSLSISLSLFFSCQKQF